MTCSWLVEEGQVTGVVTRRGRVRANRGLELREVLKNMPTPNAAPPPAEEREPVANSPQDVGFTNFETSKPAPPPPAPARQHAPKQCKSCPAPILWAQVLDDDGQRVKNEDGRYKSMPVDWDPTPTGNVVVYWREGEGFVCRTLGRGEAPRVGEKLRTSHFATCPNAKQHRRKNR